MREFTVTITIPQPLETACRLLKVPWARNIAQVLLVANKVVSSPHYDYRTAYVSEISINLFGRPYVVWDYLNGKKRTRLKI